MNSYYPPYSYANIYDNRQPTIFYPPIPNNEFSYNQPINNVLTPFNPFAFDYNTNQFVPTSYRSHQSVYPAAERAHYPTDNSYAKIDDANDDAEHIVGIVNGFRTDITDEPYQANLRYREHSFCGASIISSKHCLTAGHCYRPATDNSEYSVLVGTQDILNNNHNGVVALLQHFIVHPSFRNTVQDPYRHDIAVLVLRGQLPIDGIRIAKIALPEYNQPLPVGQVGLVSGW
jgi:hypothetical protein